MLKSVAKIMIWIILITLLASCKNEAEKHKDVCLYNEYPLIECRDVFFRCRVVCYPKDDKINNCLKWAEENNLINKDNIIQIMNECKKPIVRWI